MKDKSIVVTGGNGFLGSKIVSLLRQRGAEKITIPSSETCDLRIRENCENITKNADIVFHIAFYYLFTPKYHRENWKISDPLLSFIHSSNNIWNFISLSR